MPNILTPLQIWNNFDDSLPLECATVGEVTEGNIIIERVRFSGRDAGDGRVSVYASFARDVKSPSTECVLVFPDSVKTIDDEVLKMIVRRGYSALMVDYRGEWEGTENYTVYPQSIEYANTAKCGRSKDYVDNTAIETCWYEWVAVGIYARKYIVDRTGNENIAVLGLRDGGEIAWKLGVAKKFACIVPVCAAGWKAYEGISKFKPDEHQLDEERYRYIAGIDSQAYAPYVQCPVLIMCSTNDPRFDYDRAYDTFSRINHDFAEVSVITYSVNCDACIGVESTADMFMFFDRNLKNRQIFIPHPAEVTITVDEDENLVARAAFDDEGEVESYEMYMAEDCIDSALREWTKCPYKGRLSGNEHEFFMNIYEKTGTVFALCAAKYTNGFTVWSKIVVKKISGSFRNMQIKCRVIYTAKNGNDGFSVTDNNSQTIGGIFFTDDIVLPQIVEKARGIKGIYSVCGLTTFRLNNPRYAPEKGVMLKIDVFCDNSSEMDFTIKDVNTNEVYKSIVSVVGGVWQPILLESKAFKTASGAALPEYSSNLRLDINCGESYAVTNMMWL